MKHSDNPGIINHEGKVQKKDGKSVIVSIIASTACSGCHAEDSCTMSGKEEKIIEIAGSYNVKPGDNVIVQMNQSMGYAALILGYILPLITVVTILIIMISLENSELVSGIISLGALIPYYTVLYFLRGRINKKFTFTLKV
jgi:sigma-E factor negative regulatory protein RseC